MADLFKRLVDFNLISAWADILDWIFDDDKFNKPTKWERNDVARFTKAVKKLNKIGKNNYFYGNIKSLDFPEKKNTIYIVHAKKDSEGRDLVRHIRNGIAHGKTKCRKNKNELYIEIKDYTIDGKQTAHIYFPISYICDIQKIYKQVQNKIKSRQNEKR